MHSTRSLLSCSTPWHWRLTAKRRLDIVDVELSTHRGLSMSVFFPHGTLQFWGVHVFLRFWALGKKWRSPALKHMVEARVLSWSIWITCKSHPVSPKGLLGWHHIPRYLCFFAAYMLHLWVSTRAKSGMSKLMMIDDVWWSLVGYVSAWTSS